MAELQAAEEEFLSLIRELDQAAWEKPLTTGGWRVRDMIAHISHWNRWGLNRMRQIVLGDPPLIVDKGIDVEEANRRIAALWNQHPINDVLAELQFSFDDIISFLKSLSAETFDQQWTYWDKIITISDSCGHTISHARYHLEQLRVLLAGN